MPVEYEPYQESTQLARYIKDYPRSFTRNPSQPLIQRPLSLSERTGPIDLKPPGNGWRGHFLQGAGGPRAIGQFIAVTGRLMDEDGAPLAGAVIEILRLTQPGNTFMNWIATRLRSIRTSRALAGL